MQGGFNGKATDDYSAVFSFEKNKVCESAGLSSVRFCGNSVYFSNGEDQWNLVTLLAAADKARRLAEFDGIEVASLAHSHTQLANLDARIAAQAALLESVIASL